MQYYVYTYIHLITNNYLNPFWHLMYISSKLYPKLYIPVCKPVTLYSYDLTKCTLQSTV